MDTEIDNKKTKTKKKVIYDDLEGKILLVTVGTAESPSTQNQIDNLRKEIEKEIKKKSIDCIVLVGDHTTTAKIIEKQK